MRLVVCRLSECKCCNLNTTWYWDGTQSVLQRKQAAIYIDKCEAAKALQAYLDYSCSVVSQTTTTFRIVDLDKENADAASSMQVVRMRSE